MARPNQVGIETTVKLKPGREGPARAGHPWIFSGAIAELVGDPRPGAFTRVVTSDGDVVGVGTYNPRGAIAVRLIARGEVAIGAELMRQRVAEAFALRSMVGLGGTSAYRLVNGEGDWLPGVVVDVYARFAVLQIITAGAERLRDALIDALGKSLSLDGIFERSAGGARREEGLTDRVGVAEGAKPPERIEIREGLARFLVDVHGGQKTGFYIDQRDNRARVGRLAAGRRVLNCFAYTGGFGITAALGGAEQVVSVESSGPAARLAEENWQLNDLPAERGSIVVGDVFDYLSGAPADRRFDLIVLDPPPFARHRADRESSVRGYRDLNRRALRLLSPGGLLLTCSCSSHLPRAEFEHIVATSGGPRMRLQIIERLSAGADHPVLAAHGEGEYLKGLLVRLSG